MSVEAWYFLGLCNGFVFGTIFTTALYHYYQRKLPSELRKRP